MFIEKKMGNNSYHISTNSYVLMSLNLTGKSNCFFIFGLLIKKHFLGDQTSIQNSLHITQKSFYIMQVFQFPLNVPTV